MPPSLHLQRWTSTDNQEEIHYFLRTDVKEIYIFGYNPRRISPIIAKAILTLVELDLNDST